MRKPVFWGIPIGYDTNRNVQLQKMAMNFKFWSLELERLYYLCSGNNGADQLTCEFVFAFVKCRFSHDAAHLIFANFLREACLGTV